MEGAVWLACVIGVVPVVVLVLWWWNDIWYGLKCGGGGTKLPPGHMGLPFFGELFILRKRYGDGIGMYRTHLFRSPSIIACSPSANKFVFQATKDFILKWPTVDILGTSSIISVEGAAHTRIRSFVTGAINKPDALRRIARSVQPRVVAALRSWAHKGRVVAYTEAKKVTFENISKIFCSFEPGPLLDCLDEVFNGIIRAVRASPINFPGTAYHRGIQCRKKAEAIFWGELERRKKNLEAANSEDDLMDGLMRLKDEQGKHLQDIEVVDNIINLVIGGFESTSLAIIWAIYLLSQYPDVLQKLRGENIPLSKERNGDFITSEDVSKLKYTNKVVEETIRLANIAFIVFRTATKDVEYKGYKIPKGWNVILWVRYLHTDPENFADPMCFNPDRWNEPARPGTYQAFGGGTRICAGNMLARLQLAIFLHHLAVGYKWELVNPKAEMAYLPNQMPVDGAEITFTKI